jgi:hypothetical protein
MVGRLVGEYKESSNSTRHFLCVNRELHTGIIQPMWFESNQSLLFPQRDQAFSRRG